MTERDLMALSATEIAHRVASGAVTPVEVTEAAFAQVRQRNPELNAIVTVDDRALSAAQALEKALADGAHPGPLCGVPVGIKDITPVAGLRTTYGSALYADHVPDADAIVVERLRAAGAIVIGKTNTPEFASGANTYNDVFGPTRNPWDPALSAGGSTGGGAAALASGMIAIGEGRDLGGSLRIPAAFCGVVGIRPSPGLVPTWPTDTPWDDLSVTGPMARTAEDVALALQVMAGPDPRSPMTGRKLGTDFVEQVRTLDVEGLRIGYSPDVARIGIDPAIEAVCRTAALGLESPGAQCELVDLDLSEGRKAFLHLRGLWYVTHHRSRMDRLDELGDNVRGNIEAGLGVTTDDLAWAQSARHAIWKTLAGLFERHDLLLTPTMAVPPFPVEQNYPTSVGGKSMKTYVDWMAPTFVLSLAGLPVASVPCGLDANGLPIGLQVVGPPLSEAQVLGLCSRIQEAHPIGGPEVAKLA